MTAAHWDLHRDRFVRARRDDGALPDLLRTRLALRSRRALSGLAALAPLDGAVAPAANRGGAPPLGTLSHALLRCALRPRGTGGTRALALATLLGRENFLGLRLRGRSLRLRSRLRLRRLLGGLGITAVRLLRFASGGGRVCFSLLSLRIASGGSLGSLL